MATLNFPSNPQIGDTYTIGTRTWVWNGNGWQLQSGITSFDPFTASRVIVTTSTNSTSTNSGGLIVYGGAGIGLDLTVGGSIHVLADVSSYSSTSGAVTIAGGLGVIENVYAGALYDNNSRVITQATLANQGVTALYAGTDTAVNSQTGVVYVWNTSTLQSVTGRGNITDSAIIIKNTFDAYSTLSGALTVSGGIALDKNLYGGGNATFFGQIAAGGQYNAIGTTGTVSIASMIPTLGVVGTTSSAYQLMVANPDSTDALLVGVSRLGNVQLGSLGTNNGSLEIFAGSASVPGLQIGGLTGQVRVMQPTSSTNTYSGSLVVVGGAGFGSTVYIENTSYVGGAQILTTATIGLWAVSELRAGTDTYVNTTTGIVTVSNTSTLDSVVGRGNVTTTAIRISNGTAATDQSSGALTVLGGVGVGGSLYAGNLYANGSAVVTQATLGSQGVISITAGTDTVVNTSSGAVSIWNTSTLESITGRGATTTRAVNITNTSGTTSSTTGALQVAGGVGVGENLYVQGTISAAGGFLGLDPTSIFQNTSSVTVIDSGTVRKVTVTIADNTNTVFTATGAQFFYPVTIYANQTSSGTDSGALTVAGGVGVAGSIYAGSTSYVKGEEILTTATVGSYVLTTVTAGTDTAANTIGRVIYIWNTSTLQSVTSRGSSTNQVITFTNQTEANNTGSGAIVVSGGAGIGKSLWVGGNIYTYGNATVLGNLTVLGTQTTIYSTATSIQDPVLNIGAPPDLSALTTDDGLDKGILVHYNTLTSVAGDTHAFFGLRRQDEKFVFITRTPQQGKAGLDNPFATTSTLGGAAFGTLTLTSGYESYSPNTGDLQVTGGVGIQGNLYTAGLVRVTNATSATSTITGALQIVGGVGIQGDLYVGGKGAFVNGFEVVTTASIGIGAVANIVAGTDTAVTTATGNVTIWNTSTLQSVTSRGSSTTNAISITNATISSTTTNGAFIVTGGVGIGLTLNIGGDTRIWSTTSNSLQAGGGATFGGDVNAGGTGNFGTSGSFGTTLTVGSSATSTGTSTGALIVQGGVGIGGNTTVGRNLTAGGTINVTSTATLGDNLLLGSGAVTRNVHGSQFISNGSFAIPGDAQAGIYLIRMVTDKDVPTSLTLDGISISTVNQISLPNQSTYNFKIYVIARSISSDDEAGWEFNGVISRYANPGSTSIKVVNKTKLWSSNALWDCNVVADTVNGALQVLGTGDNIHTIRFVGKVETVEVTN